MHGISLSLTILGCHHVVSYMPLETFLINRVIPVYCLGVQGGGSRVVTNLAIAPSHYFTEKRRLFFAHFYGEILVTHCIDYCR